MKRSYLNVIVLAGCVLTCSARARAEHDIRVDLKNVSGETKTDWPVVLRVYTVFGRNLEPTAINAEGYHVYDAAGKEVPHAIEAIPPADQPGNNEIIFVVPKMAPGEVLSYRITNTAQASSMRRAIDVVGSVHNLLTNGSFEAAGEDGAPVGFAGQARRDTETRHSGEASLMLTAEGKAVSTRHVRPVNLHKQSWYYFGAWSKTRNVSRFGYEAGDAAHFKLTYADSTESQPTENAVGWVVPQCSTRDWLKVTFESAGYTDWGVERYRVQAGGAEANVEFILDQQRHYYMQAGQRQGTWWLDDAALLEQPEVRVRFDLSVEPLIKDGVFLFTRTPEMPLGKLQELDAERQRMWPYKTEWCAMPFAHEKLTNLDRFALKGQRVSYCVGLYHTRPIDTVVVRPRGEGLRGPDGAQIPVETVEYCPGYLGDEPSRYMKILNSGSTVEPANLKDRQGVRYFFVTFHVPRDAAAGTYTGAIEVLLGQEGPHRTIPVSLRVQELAQPVLTDVYVGLIYNGGLPDVDDMLVQYSRSGFNCVTWFHRWLPFRQDEAGKWHIDAETLDKKMKQLLDLGITAGVCLYTDVQLDDKPQGHRGVMFAHADGQKDEYFRMMRELEAAVAAHPEWPRIIYMNWDEPPPFHERMGWTNEVTPNAITTLDVQFARLPRIMRFYNMPNFDDPANWAGPELYDWVRSQGKDFGLCGATDTAEANRYQAGMFMITSGAKYFHAWHIRGGHTPGQMAYDDDKKQTIRGHEMIAWAGGMDDLKAYHLLRDTIDEATRSGRNAAAVRAAESYLASVFAVFNGDHRDRWSLQPYLGAAWSWGYEGFYDDWQEKMARHAAAIKGVSWVD